MHQSTNKWPDLIASVQPITFLFRKCGVSHILHFIWEVRPGGTRQGPGEMREERRESMPSVIKSVITVSTWSIVLLGNLGNRAEHCDG